MPGTLAGSNGARLQHLLQMIPNLLNQWWKDSPEPFLKRGIVSHFYDILRRVGTA